jgi:hypothetical protein
VSKPDQFCIVSGKSVAWLADGGVSSRDWEGPYRAKAKGLAFERGLYISLFE